MNHVLLHCIFVIAHLEPASHQHHQQPWSCALHSRGQFFPLLSACFLGFEATYPCANIMSCQQQQHRRHDGGALLGTNKFGFPRRPSGQIPFKTCLTLQWNHNVVSSSANKARSCALHLCIFTNRWQAQTINQLTQ